MDTFDVTAEDAFDAQGQPAILIKLSSRLAEVKVFVPCNEADAWQAFIDQPSQLGIRAGTSTNSHVHWEREGNDIHILIGEDSESWDIGVVMDEAAVRALREELGALRKSPSWNQEAPDVD